MLQFCFWQHTVFVAFFFVLIYLFIYLFQYCYEMHTIPLYGLLYIGYAYRKSMGVQMFHLELLTLKGHGQGQGY